MPTNKDFKRLVRARMVKTGEAYTAARATLLKRTSAPPAIAAPTAVAAPEPAAAAPPPTRPDYARLAGMSDAAIRNATGCTWEKWVWALDRAGADAWSHRAIADYVHTTYKVQAWWTQTVTVGYERIKGLRAIGQQRNGGYEATRSTTLSAPAARVFRAFANARARRAWLPDVKVQVRKATPNRSVRMSLDDGTLVEVWLVAKGAAKTAAQVQHRKLSGKDDAEQRKRFWGERLNALRDLVEAR